MRLAYLIKTFPNLAETFIANEIVELERLGVDLRIYSYRRPATVIRHESARRIRLLVELQAAGERGLTLTQILAAYNARMIVDARLGRLLAGGQVVERDGRYFIGKPLMLYGAKALVLLKIAFLGAPDEFARRRRD